jgi:hypothetical protein
MFVDWLLGPFEATSPGTLLSLLVLERVFGVGTGCFWYRIGTR